LQVPATVPRALSWSERSVFLLETHQLSVAQQVSAVQVMKHRALDAG
jgi:hypothetical protein